MMTAKVELITPSRAEAYLGRNCDYNRSLSRRRVDVYARDMKAGKWQLNGEAIRFDTNGVLLDGQHRLAAIVKSGIPVQMMVIRGVSTDVNLYDRGYTRSTHASLLMGGMDKSVANLSTCAVAKLWYLMKYGETYATDAQIGEFLEDNADEIAYVYQICSNSGTKGGRSGRVKTHVAPLMMAVLLAIKNGESRSKLARFTDVISSGFYDGSSETAAVIARNDMISGVINPNGGATERTKAVHQFEKAIKDFCAGTPRQITYGNWEKSVYKMF